jgi:hypothetical protein
LGVYNELGKLTTTASREPRKCKQKKEKVMHIDKYVVNNIGTKWTNGKDKKNCILDSLDGIDGIELKKLVPLLDQWFETVTGGWSDKTVELVINVKENDRK